MRKSERAEESIGLVQAKAVVIAETAKELISEVFEVWDSFDQEVARNHCPGCQLFENRKKDNHEDWCWFGRARKWLESNRLQVPEVA